ncbi:MAG: hypothetical protein UY98_C0022G0008, partial [Candidatus Kaiserbacteria bacterium GW2011_GWA2_58_9]
MMLVNKNWLLSARQLHVADIFQR